MVRGWVVTLSLLPNVTPVTGLLFGKRRALLAYFKIANLRQYNTPFAKRSHLLLSNKSNKSNTGMGGTHWGDELTATQNAHKWGFYVDHYAWPSCLPIGFVTFVTFVTFIVSKKEI